MEISHPERLRQLAREKALYRYQLALERHDFDIVATVLQQAETDPILAEMLFEVNEALASQQITATREALVDEMRSSTLIATALGMRLPYCKRTRPISESPSEDDEEQQFYPDEEAETRTMGTGAGNAFETTQHSDQHEDSEQSTLPSDDGSHHAPDAYRRREDENSPEVTQALIWATVCITQGSRTLGSYLKASRLLLKIQHLPMARRQQLRVNYLLGMSFAAAEEYPLALNCVDEAAELAIALDDSRSLIEMLYLRGAICSAALRFRDASADYQSCIDLLHAQNEGQPDDPDFELELWSRQAAIAFYLAQPDTSEQCLHQTRRLGALIPESRGTVAAAELVRALLLRQRGQPEVAIRHALAAAEVYSQLDSPFTAARAQLMVAEVALDLAQSVTWDTDRSAFIQLAQPHCELAGTLVKDGGDIGGESLVSLTRVRLNRLSRKNSHRFSTIEQIVWTAKQRGDTALLAQSLTTLADELAFLGEVEQSLNINRQVLDVLHGSDLPALGLGSRRALLRAGEQRATS